MRCICTVSTEDSLQVRLSLICRHIFPKSDVTTEKNVWIYMSNVTEAPFQGIRVQAPSVNREYIFIFIMAWIEPNFQTDNVHNVFC